MKSDAIPAIHGFDGSETMTSYWLRPSSRWVRPSPTISRVRGSASAREFSGSKKREASTTSGEISSTSTRSSGWRSADPSVTPLPRPRIAACRGAGWSSSGTCASSRWVSMSPAFDASTLPSMASDVVPAASRTATVTLAPSRK